MRKIIGLLILCTLVQYVHAQEKWSLRKCVDYAMLNNLNVQQAIIRVEQAEVNYLQSQKAKDPTLNASLGTGLQLGRSIDPATNQFTNNQISFLNGSVNGNMLLFNWGTQKNTVEANRLLVEANKADVNKQKEDIALFVANGYLAALLAYEQINNLRTSLMQSKEQYVNTRKRVDAGALPELSALELDAQIARDSSSLVGAITNYDIQLLTLKTLLNIDAALPFDIERPAAELIPVEPIADLQPDIVYNLAVVNRPGQQSNKLFIDAQKKNLLVAQASKKPTLSAFASMQSGYSSALKNLPSGVPVAITIPIGQVNVAGTNYTVTTNASVPPGSKKANIIRQFDNNFRQSIGVSLGIPILDGGQAKASIKRSELNIKNLELTQNQLNATLKNDIYKAYQSAVAALQVFNAAKKATETAQKSFDLGSKRFNAGLLSTFDLNTLQTRLLQSKIDQSRSQYDYIFKMKVLEFYKGSGIKL